MCQEEDRARATDVCFVQREPTLGFGLYWLDLLQLVHQLCILIMREAYSGHNH
jgi:hypothetical protein